MSKCNCSHPEYDVVDESLFADICRVLPKTKPFRVPFVIPGRVDGCELCLVDGGEIMLRPDEPEDAEHPHMDFVTAANDEEAAWVRREFGDHYAILDVNLDPSQWRFDLYHELHERRLMALGLSYEHAHIHANTCEKQLRLRARRCDSAIPSQYDGAIHFGLMDMMKSTGMALVQRLASRKDPFVSQTYVEGGLSFVRKSGKVQGIVEAGEEGRQFLLQEYEKAKKEYESKPPMATLERLPQKKSEYRGLITPHGQHLAVANEYRNFLNHEPLLEAEGGLKEGADTPDYVHNAILKHGFSRLETERGSRTLHVETHHQNLPKIKSWVRRVVDPNIFHEVHYTTMGHPGDSLREHTESLLPEHYARDERIVAFFARHCG